MNALASAWLASTQAVSKPTDPLLVCFIHTRQINK